MGTFIYEENLFRADNSIYHSSSRGDIAIADMDRHHLTNALRRIEQDCLAKREEYRQNGNSNYEIVRNLNIVELCSVFVPQYNRLLEQDRKNQAAKEAEDTARQSTSGVVQVIPVVNPTNEEIRAALNPLDPVWNKETGTAELQPSAETPAAVLSVHTDNAEQPATFEFPRKDELFTRLEEIVDILNLGPSGLTQADCARINKQLDLARTLVPVHSEVKKAKMSSTKPKSSKVDPFEATLNTPLRKLNLTDRRHDARFLNKLMELSNGRAKVVRDLEDYTEADMWAAGAEPSQVQVVHNMLRALGVQNIDNTKHRLLYSQVQLPQSKINEFRLASNSRWIAEFNRSYDLYVAGTYRLRGPGVAGVKNTTKLGMALALRERVTDRIAKRNKKAKADSVTHVRPKSGILRTTESVAAD